MNKIICFMYDIGHKFGMGHLNRCLAINQKLLKKKISTYYLNSNNYDTNIIKKQNHKIIHKKDLIKFVGLNNILIVDSYNINQRKINELARYFKYIFLINDIPNKNLSVYGLLNSNYKIKKKDFNEKKIRKFFLGINYKFIRKVKIPFVKNRKGITISFGGGNVYFRTKNYILSVLKFLNNINFDEKIIIYMNLNYQQKKEILKFKNLNIKICNISNNFIKMAYKSKFVISSLGMQHDELYKLKIPSIFLKIAKNQEQNYKFALKINPEFTHDLKKINKKTVVNTLSKILIKKKRFRIIKNYNSFQLGKKTNFFINHLKYLFYN